MSNWCMSCGAEIPDGDYCKRCQGGERRCPHCEMALERNGTEYNGCCGPACFLHHLLTLAGSVGAISGMDAILGRKAIEEMRNGEGV